MVAAPVPIGPWRPIGGRVTLDTDSRPVTSMPARRPVPERHRKPSSSFQLESDLTRADRIWSRAPSFALGSFHAGARSAEFRASGPYACHYLVLPRTTTEIRPSDGAPCVCSPALLVLHEPGTRLSRKAITPRGDECDYIAIAPAAMDRVFEQSAPQLLDRGSRWPRRTLPMDGTWLDAVRRLIGEARARPMEALELEERLLPLIGAACARIVEAPARARRARRTPDLAEAAKSLLAERHGERWTLERLASAVHASPCHLSREFQARVGMSLHQYLVRLRLCAGYDAIASGQGDLARVAIDLGFAHHSHLTYWYRRVFGTTPTNDAARRRALEASIS